jgi:hypothetical protein
MAESLTRFDLLHVRDGSSRAEINPQPRKSRSPGRNWLLLASG